MKVVNQFLMYLKVKYLYNITITIDQGDNYGAACLLDQLYFKAKYNNFPKNLSEQPAFNAGTKAVQKFGLSRRCWIS